MSAAHSHGSSRRSTNKQVKPRRSNLSLTCEWWVHGPKNTWAAPTVVSVQSRSEGPWFRGAATVATPVLLYSSTHSFTPLSHTSTSSSLCVCACACRQARALTCYVTTGEHESGSLKSDGNDVMVHLLVILCSEFDNIMLG